MWLKAAPGDQAGLVRSSPECYFVPPYLGKGGWVGGRLDGVADWDEVAELVSDTYRLTAPKRLCALLDERGD